MSTIPVFYTPKMVADSRSASPSAAKPIKVVESWQRQFDVTIHEPEPVTVEELCRAHDKNFVDEILTCRQANGFGNKSSEVAASLPYTSGAMLAAARHAMLTRAKIAVAPVSGFHHAGYESPQGFCTFNGLMVTALTLKAEGATKVGILDLDMHYGNGTDEIIRKLGLQNFIRHFTGGAKYDDSRHLPEWMKIGQVTDFFYQLPGIVESMSDCDVVLYQAGADPHVKDPYGGWLSTAELRHRDEVVFDILHASGTPVAWNLAGGYQTEPDGSIPKVLEIHDNTMRECVRVYGG